MDRQTLPLAGVQPIQLTFSSEALPEPCNDPPSTPLADDTLPWLEVGSNDEASNQSVVCSERIRITDDASASDSSADEEAARNANSANDVTEGGADDEHMFGWKQHNRSRVTFVGLDGSASEDDVEEDDNEDFRNVANRLAQHRNPTPPPPLDPRFVPVATTAGQEQAAAATAGPAVSARLQRPTPAQRHHLMALTANEVHRIFRRHWEMQHTNMLPFHIYQPTSGEEAMRSAADRLARERRHATLVNVSNWNGAAADDVCMPATLLPPLPNAAVQPQDGDSPAAQPHSTIAAVASSSSGVVAVTLRPHQVNGIRFMWRNLMEGPLEHVPAVGCILAHSMGLGKTGQVVVFLHLMARQYRQQQQQQRTFGGGRSPTSSTGAASSITSSMLALPRVVIVAPKSVLAAWESEFEKWSAFFPPTDRIKLTVMDDRMPKGARVEGFRQMMRDGGLVAIGYEALVFLEKEFMELHLADGISGRGAAPDTTPFQHGTMIDLVVCDEGHRLKSSNLDIAKSLSRLNALRRLVLTGTPLQNHLLEYWAMSDFAVPKFFDRRTFLKFFVQPIQKAADSNASEQDVLAAKKKTFILVQEFANFTQRVDNEPLRAELPPLNEYVVTLPLSKLQHSLYMKFLNLIRLEHGAKFNVLQAFSYASKICAHPQLLFDGDVAMGMSAGAYAQLTAKPADYEFNPDDGVKMQMAVHIARAAAAINEKTLIFSTSTKLLDLLEVLIRKADQSPVSKRPREGATVGEEATSTVVGRQPPRLKLLRIDGASSAAERERKIDEFQSPATTYNCFLLSTKAGGVGITVTAATRVILLDCSFNPADDRQAIGRAYRYGQTKPVVVYRLVCRNTIEHRIFDQKVGKEWMFETVINDKNIKRDALSGVKLRHMFLMKDARPVAAIDPVAMQSMLPERVRQATRAIVDADPILQADEIQRSICSVTTFDSYLELDHSEQYGSDEANGYAAYRRSGGLQQADAEDPETRLRLDKEAASQWTQVKAQSKTLSAIITQLIHERSESSDRIRDYLKKLHVVHDSRFDPLAGAVGQQHSAAMLPASRRHVAPLLVDVTSSDDDDDVTLVATTGPSRPQQIVATRAVNPLRPLVDPRAYTPYPPLGSSRDNAVDIDDD